MFCMLLLNKIMKLIIEASSSLILSLFFFYREKFTHILNPLKFRIGVSLDVKVFLIK